MKSVELKCRFLTNDDGKHTFQIYSSTSGNNIFTCPVWFDTREIAEEMAETLKERFVSDMSSITQFNAEDDITDFGTFDPGVVNTGKVHGDLMKKYTLNAGCTMAVHKSTAKFGVAVSSDKDEVLIKPAAWFDTPEEAFKYAKDHIKDYVSQITQIGIEKGFVAAAFLEPRVSDFKLENMPKEAQHLVEQKRGKKVKVGVKTTAPTSLLAIDQLCELLNLDPTKVVEEHTNPQNLVKDN